MVEQTIGWVGRHVPAVEPCTLFELINVLAGFMKQLPNLLKQETSSLHASLGVLYRMYADTKRQSDWDDVEHRLFRFANQIMSSFLALQV